MCANIAANDHRFFITAKDSKHVQNYIAHEHGRNFHFDTNFKNTSIEIGIVSEAGKFGTNWLPLKEFDEISSRISNVITWKLLSFAWKRRHGLVVAHICKPGLLGIRTQASTQGRMIEAFNTAVSVNHLWFSPYLSLCLCAFDERN